MRLPTLQTGRPQCRLRVIGDRADPIAGQATYGVPRKQKYPSGSARGRNGIKTIAFSQRLGMLKVDEVVDESL